MDKRRIAADLERTFDSPVSVQSKPEDQTPMGAVRYTALVDDGRVTAHVIVSNDLVEDPVFPLEGFLLEEFTERLAALHG